MGTFTLTVNGVDRSTALVQESIRIREVLRGRGTTCEFTYRSVAGTPPLPEGGNEIVISNGATREFGGHLLVPTFEQIRDEFGRVVYDFACQCSDYTWLLDRYNVYDRVTGTTQVYDSQAAGTTITSIINTFTDGTFTTAGIDAGLTAQVQEFDAVPISECLDRLARETGYVWRVNYSRAIQFFAQETNQAPIATVDLDNDTRVYDVAGDWGDVSQVHNAIMLKDVQVADTVNTNQYFTANGVTRFYPLGYPPSPQTANFTLTVGGTPWVTRFDDQNGFGPNDGLSGTGTAFLCVFNRGFRTESALTAGTVITAGYKRAIPRLARKEDAASQAEMARREGLTGTLGVHEHVISLPQLQAATVDEAEARLDLALLQYAWPRQRIRFKTQVSGWAVGQYAQMLSSILNVNRRLYVTSLSKRVLDGLSGTWEYEIEVMDQIHGDM